MTKRRPRRWKRGERSEDERERVGRAGALQSAELAGRLDVDVRSKGEPLFVNDNAAPILNRLEAEFENTAIYRAAHALPGWYQWDYHLAPALETGMS